MQLVINCKECLHGLCVLSTVCSVGSSHHEQPRKSGTVLCSSLSIFHGGRAVSGRAQRLPNNRMTLVHLQATLRRAVGERGTRGPASLISELGPVPAGSLHRWLPPSDADAAVAHQRMPSHTTAGGHELLAAAGTRLAHTASRLMEKEGKRPGAPASLPEVPRRRRPAGGAQPELSLTSINDPEAWGLSGSPAQQARGEEYGHYWLGSSLRCSCGSLHPPAVAHRTPRRALQPLQPFSPRRCCLQQPQGAWCTCDPGVPGKLLQLLSILRTTRAMPAGLAPDLLCPSNLSAARPSRLQGTRAAPPRQAAQREAVFRSSMVEPELPFAFRSSMADPPLRGRS